MTDTNVATLEKHGDTVIRTELAWTTQGLLVKVRAHQDVEDFMRSLGTGELTEPKATGHRYWEPQKGSELLCYDLSTNLGILTTEAGAVYRFDRVGYPLLEQTDYKGEVINLSFLRLAGISSVSGVTFRIKGIYSLEARNRMRELLGMAQRRFYFSFMKPTRAVVNIVMENPSM